MRGGWRAALDRAHLGGANLENVNLRQATVRHASLTGADLTGADLTGADLTGADLSEVQGLSQSQLEGAYGSETTKLPVGFQPPAVWTSENQDSQNHY